MIACGLVVKPSCSDCGFESSLFLIGFGSFSHRRMAFKSSYLLFYPKQPYFCQADWKGRIGQRFVSCYVVLNCFFRYQWISFSSWHCCEFPHVCNFIRKLHQKLVFWSFSGQISTHSHRSVTSFEFQ